MLKSTGNRVQLLRWLLLCAGFVLAAQWLGRGWAINQWSLQELKWRIGAGGVPGQATEGHRRAMLWRAQDALASGNAHTAQSLLEPLVEQGDILVLSAYGDALAAQGERVRAVQVWEQAEDFNSLRAAGQAWAAEGRVDEAQLAFRAAYLIRPEQVANAYFRFLEDSYGLEAGERFLRRVLADYPKSPYTSEWFARVGNNVREQGRLGEAERIYLEALAKAPDTVYLITGLGWVYYDKGNREQAVKAFENAIDQDTNRGEGQFAMGELLAREGRYKEADAWFEQALALQPGSRNWCMRRGHAARDGADYALAIQVYQVCIERFPKDMEARFSLAWAYYSSQDYQNATLALEEALTLTPDPGLSGWIRAGVIYEAAGEMERARQAYGKALALDPVNSVAHAGLERLSQP